MKQLKVTIIACLLLLSFMSAALADDFDSARLARLEAHLKTIQSESRLSRQISGGIMVGAGALAAGTFGVLAASTPTGEFYFFDPKSFFIAGAVGGGLLILPGAITLGIKPVFESLPEGFLFAVNSPNYEGLKAKINSGETILESLAVKGRDQRLLSGVTILALGIVNLYLKGAFNSFLPSNLQFSLYGDYVDAAVIPQLLPVLVTAIPFMVIKSRSEREFESYVAWRDSGFR